jgi:hypothetical protein
VLGSLLVSPLGWIYYVPLAAGSIVAMSAGWAVSVGSIYVWASLLLFTSVCWRRSAVR